MERYTFSPVEKIEIESLFSKKLYSLPYIKDKTLPEPMPSVYALIPEGGRFYCIFFKYKGASQLCIFLNAKTRALVFGFKLIKLLVSLKHPIVFLGTKCQYQKRQMFCCEHLLYLDTFSYSPLPKRLQLLFSYLKIVAPFGSNDTIQFSCPIFDTNEANIRHMLSKRLVPYRAKYVEIQSNKLYLIQTKRFVEIKCLVERCHLSVRRDETFPDVYHIDREGKEGVKEC